MSELVDFDRVRAAADIKLFVCATNVRTGKIRVFKPHEISVDALLASACLPTLFRAVEIEGECLPEALVLGHALHHGQAVDAMEDHFVPGIADVSKEIEALLD